MKLFVRFLLVLSLLLVGRYDYLYAQTAGQATVITFSPVHPNSENSERLKAVEVNEENDDDKLLSFKKQLTSGDNIPSFLYALSSEYRTRYTKTALPCSKYSLYTTPHKYLLFGVFRI